MLSLPCTSYDRILLCLFLVFLTLFWAFLSFQIHPSKKELRESYISLRGITLHAFGKLGAYFFSHPQYDIHKYLTGLSKIDWSRSNLECWENRAITDKGRINRNEKGIFLTYIQIKRLLNLKIDSEEAAREKQLL